MQHKTPTWIRAYLAGLFDGEGYVGIVPGRQRKSENMSHTLRISISNNHPDLMKWLLKEFGGSIRKKRQKGFLNQEWRLSSKQALVFLNTIRPFLIVKKEQVEIAIEFQSDRVIGRNIRLTEEEIQTRESYRLKLMELKKYGNTTG